MAERNVYRVSQKYSVTKENGETQELKVTTTYTITNLNLFRKNVGLGKKVKPQFEEENADVVLNFCKEKFGEVMGDKLNEVVADELKYLDFLDELYGCYEGFVNKYGLRVTQCEFKFK